MDRLRTSRVFCCGCSAWAPRPPPREAPSQPRPGAFGLRARLAPAFRDPLRASGELEHGKADAIDLDLVGPLLGRRQQIAGAEERHIVVLLDAVAAHSQASDEFPVRVERRRAREEDDPALIRRRRLRALTARAAPPAPAQRI